MEYLGLVIFSLVMLVGGWWLNSLLARTRRNEGSTHGGGLSEAHPWIG
jgi:hypothetical protein